MLCKEFALIAARGHFVRTYKSSVFIQNGGIRRCAVYKNNFHITGSLDALLRGLSVHKVDQYSVVAIVARGLNVLQQLARVVLRILRCQIYSGPARRFLAACFQCAQEFIAQGHNEGHVVAVTAGRGCIRTRSGRRTLVAAAAGQHGGCHGRCQKTCENLLFHSHYLFLLKSFSSVRIIVFFSPVHVHIICLCASFADVLVLHSAR